MKSCKLFDFDVYPNGKVCIGGFEMLPRLSKGYPVISYNGKSYTVHRLVATAFIPNPENKPFVNHKDGNKLNAHVDNLEWCTPQENAQHAYETGLREDNLEIAVQRVFSGKETVYYSLNEAARALNVNQGTLSRYLSNGRYYLFQGEYRIRYGFESWEDVPDVSPDAYSKGVPKYYLGTNTDKNVRMLFLGTTGITQHLGFKRHLIQTHLNSKNPKPIQGWMFELIPPTEVSHLNLPVNKSKQHKKFMPKRKPVPIIVMDLVTGEKTEWPSSEAFADSIGVKKNTFQKQIYERKRRGEIPGYGKYQVIYKL